MKKLVRKYAVAACVSAFVAALIQKRNPFTSLGEGFKTLLQPFQGGKPAIGDKLNDLRKSTIGR